MKDMKVKEKLAEGELTKEKFHDKVVYAFIFLDSGVTRREVYLDEKGRRCVFIDLQWILLDWFRGHAEVEIFASMEVWEADDEN